jgi:hypothetical protein
VKLSLPLDEASRTMAKKRKYKSWSAYVKGLLRDDQMKRRPHDVPRAISLKSPAEQDFIDRYLLEMLQKHP